MTKDKYSKLLVKKLGHYNCNKEAVERVLVDLSDLLDKINKKENFYLLLQKNGECKSMQDEWYNIFFNKKENSYEYEEPLMGCETVLFGFKNWCNDKFLIKNLFRNPKHAAALRLVDYYFLDLVKNAQSPEEVMIDNVPAPEF